MAIVQISKIIQKQGDYADLPQLDTAEIGYATDAKRLFIGDELPPSPNTAILYNSEVLTNNSVDGTSILYDPVSGLISTSGGPTALTVENFSGNAVTTVFNLSTIPGVYTNTQIYINGVYQQKNTYTVVGNVITFSEAPPTGTNNIEVVIIQASPARYIRSSMIDYSSGTANAVLYLNSNKVSTTSSALTFDGTNLGLGTGSPQYTVDIRTGTSNALRVGSSSGTFGGLLSWDNTSEEARLWSLGAYSLILGTNGIETARLDVSGNLGLGVTPTTWTTNWKALQIGQGYSSIVGRSDTLALYIGQNWRYNGADRYIANGYATTYTQQNGQHIWTSAPSGTAGTVATFTQVMTLDASGNLGIGTGTNPLTRRLEINGSVRLSNASRVEWGGANYWIDASTAGSMTFGLAGNEVARFSTRALGIGATPSSWDSAYRALQIGPEGSLMADAVGSGISVSHNVYYNSGQKYIENDWASMYTQTSGSHRWYTAGIGTPGNTISFTEIMRTTSSGNLLIGSTTATANGKVEIHNGALVLGRTDSISEGGELQICRAGDNNIAWTIDVYGTGTSNAGSIRFINTFPVNSEKMRLDNNGNLGLGTIPSSWASHTAMQIGTSAALTSDNSLILYLVQNGYFDGTNWRKKNSGGAALHTMYDSTFIWYGAPSSGAANSLFSFSPYMTLNNAGLLGIGTGYNAIQAMLHVDNFNNILDAAYIKSYIVNDGSLILWNVGSDVAVNGNNKFIEFYYSDVGSPNVQLSAGGIYFNRGAGVAQIYAPSDYRAKDIYGEFVDSGAMIDNMKVYWGKMKNATLERPMLVAHEVQSIAPYAVTGEKDEVNDDGTPKFQSLDYSVLVPLLIAEIKSLRERISKLEKA